MGIEIVAQYRGVAILIEGAILFQPPFAGGNLAILFIVAVLRDNEFGPQWNGVGFAGADNDGRNSAVIIGDLTAFMLDTRTVITMVPAAV